MIDSMTPVSYRFDHFAVKKAAGINLITDNLLSYIYRVTYVSRAAFGFG